jgi:hypothetical protein
MREIRLARSSENSKRKNYFQRTNHALALLQTLLSVYADRWIMLTTHRTVLLRVSEVKASAQPPCPYNHKTSRKDRRIVRDGHTTRGRARTDKALEEYESNRAEFRMMDS